MTKILSVLGSKSIKMNYLLNFLRVVSGAFIGILLLPYVTRVLGPANFGKVEYVFTIINYFILFSTLGIPMYGIREISKVRDDKREAAKVLLELFSILFVTTFISYLIIFGVLFQLEKFNNYKDLLIVFSSMVVLTNIGAEWYFQGIENQLYITVRYLLVRVSALSLIYFFVIKPDDYIFYALFIVITTCGANVINLFFLLKFISKQKVNWNELNIKKHIKPVLTIFVATISVNIYLQLDNLLIGSLSGDKYVGYYSVANKLIRFVISFIIILGAVMLPRLSYLFKNDKVKYNEYLKKSFNILLIMSLPFSVYFLVFSKNIISIMSGSDFENSVLTMQILSPLCFIVSMAYFMGFLILYPQNKEKIYTIATVISAVFSLLVNFYAIKTYQQNGAAVVAVISELFAICIMFYFIYKNKMIEGLFDKNIILISIATIGMFIFSFAISSIFVFSIFNFIITSFLSFGIYIVILLLTKENIATEMYKAFVQKIKLIRN